MPIGIVASTRGEVNFLPNFYFRQVGLSTVGRKLFLFYQNWMDVKLICQTARDVLKLITFDM
jgi:hypothetical protein